MSDKPSEIPGAVHAELPEKIGDQEDTEIDLMPFEVIVNNKHLKLGVKHWVNERLGLDNYGLALHKDNPEVEEREQLYALLKTLYWVLRSRGVPVKKEDNGE